MLELQSSSYRFDQPRDATSSSSSSSRFEKTQPLFCLHRTVIYHALIGVTQKQHLSSQPTAQNHCWQGPSEADSLLAALHLAENEDVNHTADPPPNSRWTHTGAPWKKSKQTGPTEYGPLEGNTNYNFFCRSRNTLVKHINSTMLMISDKNQEGWIGLINKINTLKKFLKFYRLNWSPNSFKSKCR